MDESSLTAQLAALEASRSSLHSSFRFWEWIVVAGIVLELVVLVKEYWDGWSAYQRAIIRLPEKPSTLLFGLGVLGVAMVAGGISKELGIDSQIEKVETQIRGVNEQLYGVVSQRVSDVSEEAGAIQKRLDAASEQLSGIEQQVRVQGPRWKLLEAGKDEFIAKLKPFVGQRVAVMQCGRWGAVAPEPARVGQDLRDFLMPNEQAHQYGAGWNVEGWTWDQCPAGGGTAFSPMGGNVIVTSLASGKKVEDAAEALYEVLNKLQISTVKRKADPQQTTPNSPMVQIFGPGSPWEIAALAPSVIVILVGDNPMFDVAERTKPQKNSHK